MVMQEFNVVIENHLSLALSLLVPKKLNETYIWGGVVKDRHLASYIVLFTYSSCYHA